MTNPLRVAVVGAGPAGVYAADALSAQADVDVAVDVIDRLPTPYGLLRYGVAPDHLKMKTVAIALAKVLSRPNVRFLGNVEIGSSLTCEELREHYDAVIWSYGASSDRRLGIPGEDLPGSTSATQFVKWYSGHPDSKLESFLLDATAVAVVGVGNVAVDVARILAKSVPDLHETDIHDEVLDVLERSAVTDIYVLGRRGPVQAKWTTKELRELGELANADVIVRSDEMQLDAASEADVAEHKDVARNLEVLRGWEGVAPTGKPRRIHLRFLVSPTQVLGSDRVEGLEVERGALDGTGNAVGTGEKEVLPVQLILRSVGYRGERLDDLSFDDRSGTIPNVAGRVTRDGQPVAGEYVAGWIKRGPTGVIGTNRSDAAETVETLLSDVPELERRPLKDPAALEALLVERGVKAVMWDHWLRIDAAELAKGVAAGRTRIKIADRDALLGAAHG